jgi:hypothetical protein
VITDFASTAALKKRVASSEHSVRSKKYKTANGEGAAGVSSSAPDDAFDPEKPVTLAQFLKGERGLQLVVKKPLRKGGKNVPGPTRKAVLERPEYTAFLNKLAEIPGPPILLRNEVDDTPSPPLDFEFINELRLSSIVPEYSMDFVFGCDCPETGCKDPDDCSCTQEQKIQNPNEDEHRFRFNRHGKLTTIDDCRAIVECNDRCNCGPQCQNRVTQRGRKVPLEIFKTKNKGWGRSVFFCRCFLFTTLTCYPFVCGSWFW